MVDAISPDYYAASVENTEFSLVGRHFNNIPSDAVGLLAINNETPLAFINASSAELLYDITVVDDEHLTAVSKKPTTGHSANYLGAIVSADRQSVYWVNEAKPLPAT